MPRVDVPTRDFEPHLATPCPGRYGGCRPRDGSARLPMSPRKASVDATGRRPASRSLLRLEWATVPSRSWATLRTQAPSTSCRRCAPRCVCVCVRVCACVCVCVRVWVCVGVGGCAGGDLIPEGYVVTPKGEVLSPEQQAADFAKHDAEIAKHNAERERMADYEQAKRQEQEKYKIAPAPEKKTETPGTLKTQSTRFYFNPWVGGGFGANQAVNLSSSDSFTRHDHTTRFLTNFDSQGSPKAAVAAGVDLGTWFDYDCCDVRDVLRYFGFSLNYSHYGLNYSSQGGQFLKAVLSSDNERTLTGDSIFNSNGYVNSLAFRANARYGWLPDDQVPFGRLQLQGGIGPSINIVTQTPSEQFNLLRTRNGTDNVDIRTILQNFNSQTVVVPGLQAEIGVKYFILPQLSLGPSMQYDYFRLHGSLTGPGDLSGSYSTAVNHFIFKLNVGYNF